MSSSLYQYKKVPTFDAIIHTYCIFIHNLETKDYKLKTISNTAKF